MTRNEFIKLTGLASLGLTLLPQLSFSFPNEEFTYEQLTGRGNPDIEGEDYTSTMHKAAKIALEEMKAAAAEDGIRIEVYSAYRSFERQKEIYEKKYRQYTKQGLSPEKTIEKIIEYSTIPGTSRHHWGTDLDLIDANVRRPKNPLNPNNFRDNGVYSKFKKWMNENSEKFGFYEVYNNNPNRKGFKYEPWHFSYAPVSVPMLNAYQEKINVKEMLAEENILGNKHFSDTFISKYIQENILDINPDLIP